MATIFRILGVNDPGETNNMVQSMPDKRNQLKQLLANWEAEVKPERHAAYTGN